ncbi:hypothetical protein FQN54_006327 [Arachnomyces sp. PD_36]|nr:hypothetical protein FQN54_006327 [Arachnomyces sp. PD_36]
MKRLRITPSYSPFKYFPNPRARNLSIKSLFSPRKPTVTAYGGKLSTSDLLFPYTHGRWLVNEKKELADRYVEFDVHELCRRAASIFGDSVRCMNIDKIEGDSYKVLVLTMDDGNEVVAKIPCWNAAPKYFTVEAEVATLDFVHSHTSIPVPKVLEWNSDPTNPVGVEYILLERIPGVQLTTKWGTMKSLEKMAILERIVDMEVEISKLQFPAYGSLYFQDSISDSSLRIPVSTAAGDSSKYCVGPPCNRAWSHAAIPGATSKSRGPWSSLEDFTVASVDRMGTSPELKDHSAEYKNIFESYSKLMQSIVHHPDVIASSRPVLWHNQLHDGHLLVSPDDPTNLHGFVGWNYSTIAPMFLQSKFPTLLNMPDHYIPGVYFPELPKNFDELGEEEKKQASRNVQRIMEHKSYELNVLRKNREAYVALALKRNLYEPFQRCNRFSPSELPSLRDRLIQVSKDWSDLNMPTGCPYTIDYDLEKHKADMEHEKKVENLREYVADQLGVTEDGWVFPYKWEEARKLNEQWMGEFIDMMVNTEGKTREEARDAWPFVDRP